MPTAGEMAELWSRVSKRRWTPAVRDLIYTASKDIRFDLYANSRWKKLKRCRYLKDIPLPLDTLPTPYGPPKISDVSDGLRCFEWWPSAGLARKSHHEAALAHREPDADALERCRSLRHLGIHVSDAEAFEWLCSRFDGEVKVPWGKRCRVSILVEVKARTTLTGRREEWERLLTTVKPKKVIWASMPQNVKEVLDIYLLLHSIWSCHDHSIAFWCVGIRLLPFPFMTMWYELLRGEYTQRTLEVIDYVAAKIDSERSIEGGRTSEEGVSGGRVTVQRSSNYSRYDRLTEWTPYHIRPRQLEAISLDERNDLWRCYKRIRRGLEDQDFEFALDETISRFGVGYVSPVSAWYLDHLMNGDLKELKKWGIRHFVAPICFPEVAKRFDECFRRYGHKKWPEK